MTHYALDDVLQMGKFEGESIRDIYQFQPSYIEWLINCTDHFYIDLNLFHDLPCPTPYHSNQYMPVGKSRITAIDPNENVVVLAKKFIGEGHKIAKKEFLFTEDTKEALKRKLQGKYISKCNERQDDWL